MSEDAPMEEWECGDCGYVDRAPVDEITGRLVRRTVGDGRRSKEIEVAVCPMCSSEDWHSGSVREAFLGG